MEPLLLGNMRKRALVIVLDSVGCGRAPDANRYGDEGADTLGHLFAGIPWLRLPVLGSLGLAELVGRGEFPALCPGSSASRLTELSAGKDTTTGHWELMGCQTMEAFQTFESLPEDFLEALSAAAGTRFIGNRAASGTQILKELGEEHIRSGFPILYTSADSVLQIAAHEERFGEKRLQGICQTARALLDQRGMRVGRVIARPFTGDDSESFRRTANRHDYSLTPGETVLDRLVDAGVAVIGVGKISDIFAGKGISESHPTVDNAQGMAAIGALWQEHSGEKLFVLANLVDFDSHYGHRRDPQGYAKCLMEFDVWLGGFLEKLSEGDLLIITADHGNDPYHRGSDHTREQVPCLVVSGEGFNTGEMRVFSDVGACVERFFFQGDQARENDSDSTPGGVTRD
jgi:phosphopentomutase